MLRKLFLVCMILSFLLSTGCNNPQFLGLLKTGGLLALLNDDHGSSSSSQSYAVDGYFGIVDESANAAPVLVPLKATGNSTEEVRIVITPQEGQSGNQKTIIVDNNHFSLGDLTYKPGKMLAYKGNTLLGEVKIDTTTSESENGADIVTYRVKLLIRRRNNVVTKIEYGALKVVEKKDIVERCYIAASNSGNKIEEKELKYSEAKQINNVNQENKNSVRKRIISEYQQLLASTIDSIKNVLNDELNELLIEVNALKETKKQLEAAKDTTGLEKDTITNLISVEDALDTDLVFVYSGNANWYTTLYETYDSVAALTSGIIGDNEKSILETTVEGPGRISFLWKTISELNYDYLTFYIDNTEMSKISGETDWQENIYLLSQGSHTLKWVYSKDNKGRFDRDCGFLQDIHFTEGNFVDYVKNISVSSITANSALISWDSLGTNVTYNIYLNEEKINSANISTNSYNITGLIKENDYNVSVEPVYADGSKGAISQRILFSTTNGISVREALDLDSETGILIDYNEKYVKTQSSITYDNTDALTLLPITEVSMGMDNSPRKVADYGTSDFNLKLTVKGPGKLSFMWKVNSEDINTVLSVNGGGLVKSTPKFDVRREDYFIYGNTDWEKYEITFVEDTITSVVFNCSANLQNMRFGYDKNIDQRFTGENAGYIDNIQFISGNIPSKPNINKIIDVTDTSFTIENRGLLTAPVLHGTSNPVGEIKVYLNGEYNKTVAYDVDNITIDGLEPETDYFVQISNYYEEMESILSNKIYVTTSPSDVSIYEALDIADETQIDYYYFESENWKIVKDDNATGGYCLKAPNPDFLYESEFYFRFNTSGIIQYDFKMKNMDNYNLTGWNTMSRNNSYFRVDWREMKENSGTEIYIDNIRFTPGSYPETPWDIKYTMISENNYKITWYNYNNNNKYSLYLNGNKELDEQNVSEHNLNIANHNTLNEIKITQTNDAGLESLPATFYIQTLPENKTLNEILTEDPALDFKLSGNSTFKVVEEGEGYSLKSSKGMYNSSKDYYIECSFNGAGEISFDMLTNFDYGYVDIRLDDNYLTEINTSYPFNNYKYAVNNIGDHVLKIRFRIYNDGPIETNYFEVKNFKFESAE